MNRLTNLLRWRLMLLATLLTLAGCSRVTIAYNTADFFIGQYARDYLQLTDEQLAGWEPRLKAELARHRAEELPYLAAFFEQTLKVSRAGFNDDNMTCLTGAFRDLYRRQARLAVALSSPLLAGLTPRQIDALERRFRDEAAEDRADLATRDWHAELRKRARRYVKAIEDWTGPLNASQRALVAEITGRMPDSESAVVAYRTRQREALIAQLRRSASEAGIRSFLTAWLVDFSNLPPELDRAGVAIGAQISELFIRLGASFDERQRQRFDKRLRQLRDDLMQLQQQPRLTPPSC